MVYIRPYQLKGKRGIYNAMRAGYRNIALVLFCGLGKTTLAGSIIVDLLSRDKRVLVITHRKELVKQFHGRLWEQFGIQAGIIMSKVSPRPGLPVQVASLASLLARKFPPADVVIFDEVHHIKAATWMEIADYYRDRGATIIGMTATLERMDGKGFDDIFETIVNPISVQQALVERWILPARAWSPEGSARVDGVRVRMGKYVQKDLLERFMEDRVLKGAYDAYNKFMPGKKAIFFNVDIQHSKFMSKYFNRKGVPSGVLWSGMKDKDREDLDEKFRNGEILLLHNYNIVSEGYDVPDCEGIFLNTKIFSTGRYVQAVSRCLRPMWNHDHSDWAKENGVYRKKHGIVVDLGGNVDRHGLPQFYDLDGPSLESRKKRGNGEAPVKKCPECREIVPAATRTCECGFIFEVKEEDDDRYFSDQVRYSIVVEKHDIVKRILRAPNYKIVKSPVFMLRTVAAVKGYKNGWAAWTAVRSGHMQKAFEEGVTRELFVLEKGMNQGQLAYNMSMINKYLEWEEKKKGFHQVYKMIKEKYGIAARRAV